MSTVKAAFGGGIPLVDLDQVPPIPCCFVFQLGHKLTPTHITDRFCQTVIFDHVLDLQTLHADRLVFTDQACRELMQEVTASLSNTGMDSATFVRALARFLLPFCFLACRLCAFASCFSSLWKNLGLPTTSPVERMTNAFKPRSAPTDCSTGSSCLISSSTRMETK